MYWNNHSKSIAPSILSADFINLKEDFGLFEEVGFKILHLDVMDGHFVPNITFGAPVVTSIRKHTKMLLDVHLMIENPHIFIMDFINAGADLVTVHIESSKDISNLIDLVKGFKKKFGVSLNPETPLRFLEPILEKIDLVLLMSVNPGQGGQSFIPCIYQKIVTLRKRINSRSPNVLIEVDGGIDITNVQKVFNMGANIAVIGSAIYRAKNKSEYLLSLKRSENSLL